MTDSLALVAQEVAACRACGLAASRTHVVVGEGRAPNDLMVVGEGPGEREDELGRPFVGRSGELLDRLIVEELGRPRAEVYIANIVKCRPPGNRDPRPEEAASCRPFLDRQLALVAPRVVICLGRIATSYLLGVTTPLARLRGQVIERDGVRWIPTFHPAAALRGGAGRLTEMRVDFATARLALEGDARLDRS
jgi:uracil-DNA glycosylase family 4